MKDLENRVTHILSEWLNGNALLGEERYRNPAKAVIAECKREVLEMLRSKEANRKCIEGTIGIGTFVSHDDWAEWLERRLK